MVGVGNLAVPCSSVFLGLVSGNGGHAFLGGSSQFSSVKAIDIGRQGGVSFLFILDIV